MLYTRLLDCVVLLRGFKLCARRFMGICLPIRQYNVMKTNYLRDFQLLSIFLLLRNYAFSVRDAWFDWHVC